MYNELKKQLKHRYQARGSLTLFQVQFLLVFQTLLLRLKTYLPSLTWTTIFLSAHDLQVTSPHFSDVGFTVLNWYPHYSLWKKSYWIRLNYTTGSMYRRLQSGSLAKCHNVSFDFLCYQPGSVWSFTLNPTAGDVYVRMARASRGSTS